MRAGLRVSAVFIAHHFVLHVITAADRTLILDTMLIPLISILLLFFCWLVLQLVC